jgi:DNA-directed RNA polymerase specialized sigma24 family protein
MTLVDAVKACRWPKRQSSAKREAADRAYGVILNEARRQGARLRTFSPEDVEDAIQEFMGRFVRLRKPAFDRDDAVRGYVYSSVRNNCRSILTRAHKKTAGAKEVDSSSVDNLASGVASVEDALVAPDADTRFGPYEQAALELLPSMLARVAAGVNSLPPLAKEKRGINISADLFSEVIERCANGDSPKSRLDKRAYQRAFRAIRMFLPECCKSAGLLPLDISDFLTGAASLNAQRDALWDGPWAKRQDLDPRVPWLFAVASRWLARCRK